MHISCHYNNTCEASALSQSSRACTAPATVRSATMKLYTIQIKKICNNDESITTQNICDNYTRADVRETTRKKESNRKGVNFSTTTKCKPTCARTSHQCDPSGGFYVFAGNYNNNSEYTRSFSASLYLFSATTFTIKPKLRYPIQSQSTLFISSSNQNQAPSHNDERMRSVSSLNINVQDLVGGLTPSFHT